MMKGAATAMLTRSHVASSSPKKHSSERSTRLGQGSHRLGNLASWVEVRVKEECIGPSQAFRGEMAALLVRNRTAGRSLCQSRSPRMNFRDADGRASIKDARPGSGSFELTNSLLVAVKEYTNITGIQEKARAAIS